MVARYKNNEVKPIVLPNIIVDVAKNYNGAYIREWNSGSAQPSSDAIIGAYNTWKTDYDSKEYQRTRNGIGTDSKIVYPGIETQLDQLFHDMKDGKLGAAATTGSWYIGISSVKSAHPKS